MLGRISFQGFRNLADDTWRPHPGGQILVGPNGAGKTSLLEAAYLLATSKSFRAPRLLHCVRHGEDAFGLSGRIEGNERADLELHWGPKGIERRLNGKSVSLAEYLAVLPVVVWSAEAGRLVDGGPENRRRFLDQGIVGLRPSAISTLSRYRRALEQKRELLKTGGSGLEAWNEILAESAIRLIELRRLYVTTLEEAFAQVIAEGNLDLPPLELRYLPSPEADVAEIATSLARFAGREREARRPLVGPHRDELRLLWGGREVRRVSSAGERKAFGLLLTAARSRVLEDHQKPPLVLLDDLDAELDDRRLEGLWGVFDRPLQIVASSTRRDLAGRLGGLPVWALDDGSAKAVEDA